VINTLCEPIRLRNSAARDALAQQVEQVESLVTRPQPASQPTA
jgi:hypothetical protein